MSDQEAPEQAMDGLQQIEDDAENPTYACILDVMDEQDLFYYKELRKIQLEIEEAKKRQEEFGESMQKLKMEIESLNNDLSQARKRIE